MHGTVCATLWWVAAGAAVAAELATGTFYLLMLALAWPPARHGRHLGLACGRQLVAAAIVGAGATAVALEPAPAAAVARPAEFATATSTSTSASACRSMPGERDGTAPRVSYRGTHWTARHCAGATPRPGEHRVAAVEAAAWCCAPAHAPASNPATEGSPWKSPIVLLHRRHLHHPSFKVVPQQHAWVVERLGKYDRTLTPGLNFRRPLHRARRLQAQPEEMPLDVPSQVCITRDNTQLQVDGILYFQVTDPMRASYGSSTTSSPSRSWRRPRCARDRQDGTRQDLRGARHHQRPVVNARSTRPR